MTGYVRTFINMYVNKRKRILLLNNLRVKDGICFPSVDTAVANIRPKSAITVNVNGMPIRAKNIQNVRPPVVTGTIFPYPKQKNNR